ncbi:ABC transporter permease [Pseudolysinimonas sp.]|jgi:hypothetical protein|uniref:ABC transporter permease n=1 Tax=Pseudolysinimonas sp. TaxID=2680009 RepID=UPI00378302A9
MSAITVPAAIAARPLTQRLRNVVRLHLANPFTIIVTPLLVLGIIFLANWVIWFLVRSASPTDPQSVADVSQGFQFSGASLWTFVYMMVVAIQAMNLAFPFALGFGSTRRDFSLGTAATFVGLSAAWALIYTGLAIVEKATNGWGMGGAMFNSFYFGPDDAWGTRLFTTFTGFLFFFAIGSVFGAIYVRYRARGLILFFLALAVVLIGLVALATLTSSWGAFGEFFVAIGFLGGYALSLPVSIVAGVAGHLILRRATPRS